MTRRWVFAACAILLFALPKANAQNLLAQRADQIQAQVQSIVDAKQDVLAPSMIEDINKELEKVRKDIDKGKKPAKIVSDLDEIDELLEHTIETVRQGLEIFGPALEARDDAIFAKAPELAEDQFEDAQKEFDKAVSDLEKGKLDNAKERAPEAVTLFRDAEYQAIRKTLVEPTQLHLQQTVDSDVSKYAPTTLRMAGNHIAQADIILNRDRYAEDEVNAEVTQAEYEVNHANYIADLARQALDSDEGFEAKILKIEADIKKIADAVGYDAKFDNGTEAVANGIVAKVSKSVSGAGEENEQLKLQLEVQSGKLKTLAASEAALRDSVAQVLASVNEELDAYHEILEQRERLKVKVQQVKGSFTSDQALVEVRGQDLVIAMVGLKFNEGNAAIQPDQFALLSQVATSAKLYPNNFIYLRGIQPPPGTAESDLQLANKRLTAIREYFIAQGVEIEDERFVLTDSPGVAEEQPSAEKDEGEGEVQDSTAVEAEASEEPELASQEYDNYFELVIRGALQHD